MTNFEKNIEKLDLEDLVKAQQRIREIIGEKKTGKKQELISQFKQMAQEAGLAIEGISWHGEGKKKRRKRVAAGAKKMPGKYKNPENPGQTWCGKGRKPEWAKRWLEEGKDLDDLLIEKAA